MNIGKMNMNINQDDKGYIDLIIPVTYQMKKRDFQKLIKKLPYNTLDSRDDLYIVEFLNNNYLFDNHTIKSLNHHDDELFPVLFFTNKDNHIQKIVIDSWDSKYDHLLFGDYDVSRTDSFRQLFSIIESNKNMHFNISRYDHTIDYTVSMPVSLLDNYTRLTIKVFSRKDLDNYLPINELEF